MSSRHKIRVIVLQILYEWDFNRHFNIKDGNDCDELLKLGQSLLSNGSQDESDTSAGINFLRDLISGVFHHIKLLDDYIYKHATTGENEEIALMDMNILRLGVYELLKKENPPRVILNEAINLANTFGGKQSGKLVNGILASIHTKEALDVKV